MSTNPRWKVILDLAVDDFTGLWEIAWRLRGVSGTPISDIETRSIARATLADLLEREWVEVYCGRTFTGDQEIVPMGDLPALLRRDDVWEEPTGDALEYRVGATTKGEAAYFGAKGET